MAKVCHIKSYLFSDGNCEIILKYGRTAENGEIDNTIFGRRWAFSGCHVPFPVRCNCWFEGFSFNVMAEYLKNAGYSYKGSVNLITGRMHIYDPARKGNDNPAQKGND